MPQITTVNAMISMNKFNEQIQKVSSMNGAQYILIKNCEYNGI